MANFQEQLRNYRQQKLKTDLIKDIKSKFKKFWMLGTGVDTFQEKRQTSIEIKTDKKEPLLIIEGSDEFETSDDENELSNSIRKENTETKIDYLKYSIWAVYLMLWVTLYIIAIEVKFGLVFLMFSALFGIYFNTRTGQKNPKEISAYSIFNKNCESIDGTLKAEQFEKEIRHGFS